MANTQCGCKKQGTTLLVQNAGVTLALDTRQGLRAQWLENRYTGRRLELGGGPELEVELDVAERRLWIEGWRGAA